MSQNFYKLTEEERRKLMEEISRQNFIDEIADIDYQCYFRKISHEEFWEEIRKA